MNNYTIITIDNTSLLKSYDTIVAEFNHAENKINVFGWYSKTTAKHINIFLEHYGFDKCSKKELTKYYLS